MDGSLAIAETYIRIEDASPTPEALQRRAEQLEVYARSVGLEVFGHGLELEVLVEPGSIIERCRVYLQIAAAIGTIAAATAGLLDRDYSEGSQIRQNVDKLYQASQNFSDQIVSKVVPDSPTSTPAPTPTPAPEEKSDRSAVTTRRYTLTLGKLKRALDAAKDLDADPKSALLLVEFQRRLSLLLVDCDSEGERAQLINILQQDPPSQKALVQGFGRDYASLAKSPPDASDYALVYYSKPGPSLPAGRKRLTAAQRRALPKPVVRRFSI